MVRVLVALALLWAAEARPQQERTTAAPRRVERIVVTATRQPAPLEAVPAAVSVIEEEHIQPARPTLNLDEALNRVPGLFSQNSGNFAQDIRIQIRGFGSRSAFGLREFRVLVDGLPETLADGQTQLDSVDLGSIERIEVLRGSAASLYGNASGGVIQLFTERGPDAPWSDVRLTGGSFGLGKFQVKGGGRAGSVHGFFHGSFLRLDGFRRHSETESTVFTGKLGWDLDESTEITLLVNGVDSPLAEDPGGLTRSEAELDPRQARDLNVRLDAGEEVRQIRVGAVGRRAGESGELDAYGFFLYRDFENRLPVLPEQGDGIVVFDRVAGGAGARWARSFALLGLDHHVMLGVDFQHQDDDRRRFANLEGLRGALGLEQREQVTSVGPYLRHALALRDDLELSAGVRYDAVRFEVDVEWPAEERGSSSRTMDALSPGGGILYSPADWVTLFADVGTTFQVPTTTELARPEGAGFNPDVDPQKAIGYELGGRATWGERARAGIAGFYIDLEDDLVPFERDGRTFFRNVGSSERFGVEVDGEVELLAGLRWSAAFTFIEARFRDFTTSEGVFDGNDQPGIPPWWIFQEVSYRHSSGAYGAFEALLAEDYFVDDANTARAKNQSLLNLRGGYEARVDRWTIEPFAGLNNLLDVNYDGTVRLNARGGRFFEPAPDRHVYGGLRLHAVF